MTAPKPVDPVDWRPPPFVLTFDGADLCELALRQPTEDERYAALREVTRTKRERENAAEKEARA